MMHKQPAAFCFIVSFFCCSYCIGQTAPGDSTAQGIGYSKAVSFFNAAIGQQSRLYNGPKYCKSQLSLYTSDQTGKYIGLVQGISADGHAGSQYFTFEVE